MYMLQRIISHLYFKQLSNNYMFDNVVNLTYICHIYKIIAGLNAGYN
jgi:hypothetical protein